MFKRTCPPTSSRSTPALAAVVGEGSRHRDRRHGRGGLRSRIDPGSIDSGLLAKRPAQAALSPMIHASDGQYRESNTRSGRPAAIRSIKRHDAEGNPIGDTFSVSTHTKSDALFGRRRCQRRTGNLYWAICRRTHSEFRRAMRNGPRDLQRSERHRRHWGKGSFDRCGQETLVA